MSGPLIDATRALDDAIAGARKVRRGRLERSIHSQGLRAGIVFGLSGCMALCSLVALFAAHDPAAALVIALMTVGTFGLAYVAWRFGRNRAINELREFDQSGE